MELRISSLTRTNTNTTTQIKSKLIKALAFFRFRPPARPGDRIFSRVLDGCDWLIKTEIRDLHVRNSRTSTMASKYCSNFCSKLLLPLFLKNVDLDPASRVYSTFTADPRPAFA